MKTIIENFENGNITDAKAGAKRVKEERLYRELRERGYGVDAADEVAKYLKGRGNWQRACDAVAADKEATV